MISAGYQTDLQLPDKTPEFRRGQCRNFSKILLVKPSKVETIIKSRQKSKLYLSIGFRLLPFSKMDFARKLQTNQSQKNYFYWTIGLIKFYTVNPIQIQIIELIKNANTEDEIETNDELRERLTSKSKMLSLDYVKFAKAYLKIDNNKKWV